MNEEVVARPTISDAYKNTLLKLWIDISSNSIDYRDNFLINSLDPEHRRNFINNLIELWLQIAPKISGWETLEDKNKKSMSKKIMQYEIYYYNPAMLLDPDASLVILDFYKDLRFCIEILGITSFERVD